MFFAAGAASSAIDAIQSLTSAATSSTKKSASGTGFGLPTDVSSQASGSTSTGSATTGLTGGSQLSPATMQALLAAQSQSSTTNTSTTTTSAPASGLSVALLTPIDKSSLTSISLGSNAAWSYNSLDQMMQRQGQMMSLAA